MSRGNISLGILVFPGVELLVHVLNFMIWIFSLCKNNILQHFDWLETCNRQEMKVPWLIKIQLVSCIMHYTWNKEIVCQSIVYSFNLVSVVIHYTCWINLQIKYLNNGSSFSDMIAWIPFKTIWAGVKTHRWSKTKYFRLINYAK